MVLDGDGEDDVAEGDVSDEDDIDLGEAEFDEEYIDDRPQPTDEPEHDSISDDDDDYVEPPKKKRLIDTWTADDKLIWDRLVPGHASVTKKVVAQLIERHSDMKIKMDHKFHRYPERNRLNMLANCVRQHVLRKRSLR